MQFANVDQAFEEAVLAKTFSGAQVLLGKGAEQIYLKSYGMVSQLPGSLPITEISLFDIASLTKPVSTATLMMFAVQEGSLSLDSPVRRYLPEFNRPESITLRQALSHTSGLPAWLPIYQECSQKGATYAELREFFSSQINQTPLLHPPGAQRLYSDLGFILLGFVLESIYGLRLGTLFASKIAESIGFTKTMFNPLDHASSIDVRSIAATEACPWRGRILQGEVHDDNAFVLGGAAGHAGLFSTAADLKKFLEFIIGSNKGENRGLLASTVREFLGDPGQPKLGWDTVSRPQSQAGKYFSDQTIGHLAFTGCSFWLDLSDEKYIILLTNRVHPERENEQIKEFRPWIHDLLIESAEMGKKEI